jgi:hypothetical protein
LWRCENTEEILNKQENKKNKYVISIKMQTSKLPVFLSYKPSSLISYEK